MLSWFRLRGSSELSRRVARLGRVFALEPIIGQSMGPAQVAEYYELSFGAYRRRHSSEGSLHLALNDSGRFDSSGFAGQAQRLSQRWSIGPVQQVLELGFGHGYNLCTLAPRWPSVQFNGLDITPGHVAHVQSTVAERALSNVHVQQGDFHHLPWPDASFDHVFSIEAFCYVKDLEQALREVHRVLRPGGSFTLFDGYLPRPTAAMSADESLAVCLAAKGMAMDSLPVADELLAAAARLGFAFEARSSLDEQVEPNVRRLGRLVDIFVRWPWLARRLLARLNPVAMRNVLAGYLMGPAMQRGIWTYLELVWRKPPAPRG